MHFADEAKIQVKAGTGGAGAVSFRREKYIAFGGPDGGNGGFGGNVIFKVDPNMNTLVNYVSAKHFKAESGEAGQGNNRYGKQGEDKILKVPAGTIVTDLATGEKIADLTRAGEEMVVAKGGMGGKGNANFKSSIRQAPDFAELGEPGEEKELKLELKLIADVALVGYPNIGKSTLISRISNARPKIADYAFTTLIPNLGVVKVGDADFVVADIPGLLEGAHEGKGLGHEFLRHIERTKLLVHILDITHEDLKGEFKKIQVELKKFSPNLAKKPQVLIVNKIDAATPERVKEVKKQFAKDKPLFISAVSGEGVSEFLYSLKDKLLAMRAADRKSRPVPLEEEPRKVFHPQDKTSNTRDFEVEKEGDGYRVKGKRIEQIAVMTDRNKAGGLIRLFDVLKKIGATRDLVRLGAKEGDKIWIGENHFDFMIIT